MQKSLLLQEPVTEDSKAEDHVGRPYSAHFWEVNSQLVISVVEWESFHNALFEVSGKMVRQSKGLPIGGHLSAALVELVALYREFTQPWPLMLALC